MTALDPTAPVPGTHPVPSAKDGPSGCRPPATAGLAAVLVAAGVGVALVGTGALRLPGGRTLPLGLQLAKGILALTLGLAGGGLFLLVPSARPAARLVFAAGVVLPLYPWSSPHVDWEFMVLVRFLVSLTSGIAYLYLGRPSIVWAYAHGGVPVVHEGWYCASCNAPSEKPQPEGCRQCQGPVLELLRSPGGVAYARRT